MRIRDVMGRKLIKVSPGVTLREIAKVMAKTRDGVVFVIDGAEMLGIVTEYDIITKVVAESRSPDRVRAKDVMVSEVITIGPDDSIEDAAKLMTGKKVRKLPVVREGKLMGVVTTVDLVAAEPKLVETMEELVLLSKKSQRVAG